MKTPMIFTRYEAEALQAARRWMLTLEKDKTINAVDKFNIRMALPFINSALTKVEDRTDQEPCQNPDCPCGCPDEHATIWHRTIMKNMGLMA